MPKLRDPVSMGCDGTMVIELYDFASPQAMAGEGNDLSTTEPAFI